ncbi:carbamoyl-phosphate synthase small subunit [bacterium]|nr:MAG: carbamoyl-phosphate synthase small subunit [bacterium]
MKAILMLEDGKIFPGLAIAGLGEAVGEVIFNTAVVGYQEMLTDPANANKILVLTYPLIGNYGVAPKFNESRNMWLSGLVIKENSRIVSNWQAKSSLIDLLKEKKLPVLNAADTRTITVHLRQKGQMVGIISTRTTDPKALSSKIADFKRKVGPSLLPKISLNKISPFAKNKARKKRIAILDLGITTSILRQLQALDFSLSILPYNTLAQDIMRLKPHGLVISNGPEEDPGLKDVVLNLKPLIGCLPILGISTGHQVLAMALGAKITKMRLGHHGVNYPMHNPKSFKGEITVQNHSWVVDTESLNRVKEIRITGYNLNDRSVEEIESKKLKLLGVQYYPLSPGFNQVNEVFKRFSKMLTKE